MTGFYTAELRHLVADLQRQGKTMPGSKHQLDPQYLDGWFWTVYERAEAEDLEQVRADMVTAGARYRAELPKRQVWTVLARHREALAQREARELQVRKLRMQMAMRLHGIEPLTERERAAVMRVTFRQRVHDVLQGDQ